jgi:hypothetical protein
VFFSVFGCESYPTGFATPPGGVGLPVAVIAGVGSWFYKGEVYFVIFLAVDNLASTFGLLLAYLFCWAGSWDADSIFSSIFLTIARDFFSSFFSSFDSSFSSFLSSFFSSSLSAAAPY